MWIMPAWWKDLLINVIIAEPLLLLIRILIAVTSKLLF